MEESLWGKNVLNDGQFSRMKWRFVAEIPWLRLCSRYQSETKNLCKHLITNILSSQPCNNSSDLFAVISLRYYISMCLYHNNVMKNVISLSCNSSNKGTTHILLGRWMFTRWENKSLKRNLALGTLDTASSGGVKTRACLTRNRWSRCTSHMGHRTQWAWLIDVSCNAASKKHINRALSQASLFQ